MRLPLLPDPCSRVLGMRAGVGTKNPKVGAILAISAALRPVNAVFRFKDATAATSPESLL